jgi:hypothetical protein
MEKFESGILDKHPGSATLVPVYIYLHKYIIINKKKHGEIDVFRYSMKRHRGGWYC